MEVEKIMQELMRKHSGEPEYLQAVKEVLTSIQDVYNNTQNLRRQNSLSDW